MTRDTERTWGLWDYYRIIDHVRYMYLKFGGHGIFGFGDFASFSLHSNLAKFPLSTHGL